MLIQLRDICSFKFRFPEIPEFENVVGLGCIPLKSTIVSISSFTPPYLAFISEFQEALNRWCEFLVSICYSCLPACEICVNAAFDKLCLLRCYR